MQADRRFWRAVLRTRVVASVGAMLLVACGSASPSPVGSPLGVYELKFKVIDVVGMPFYCDPDFYPVAREGGEQASATAEYPKIRAQADLYAAIVAHEHLPSGDLTDAQKLRSEEHTSELQSPMYLV